VIYKNKKIKVMNYTKKYPQVSKAAARAKYARMAANKGMSATNSNFECGFSTWWWGKDNDYDEYAIFVSSNYHPEESLDRMYKTNCKDW